MAARSRNERGQFAPEARGMCEIGAADEPEGPNLQSVRRCRSAGTEWPEAGRARFLHALAMTCNVRLACTAGETSHTTAYRHRRQDAGFRRAWRQAIGEGYARLEIEMLERALIAETRVRAAIAEVESDKEALELLAKYPARAAETLYRAHRQTALEEDLAADADPDGEDALAALRERIEAIRQEIAAESDPA